MLPIVYAPRARPPGRPSRGCDGRSGSRHRGVWLVSLPGLFGALVACAGGESPATRPSVTVTRPTPSPGEPTGVAGVTVVDAGCPVLEGSAQCPEVPLAARVVVTRAGSPAPVATVPSGPDGRFRIGLPPGSYQLRGENLTGAGAPSAMPVPVTVTAGFVKVVVHFDSGVRGAPGAG